MAGVGVDLVLLRGLMPEVPVRTGDVLPARVLGQGMLSLAGVRVAASLPEGLPGGARLRLRVQEAGSERIVLRVIGEPEAAGASPQQAAAVTPATGDPLAAAIRAGLVVALPGGALARLFVDPEDARATARGGGGPSRVTLRYEAAAIGRVDIALEITPGAVAGTVHAPSGAAAERLRGSAADLRRCQVGLQRLPAGGGPPWALGVPTPARGVARWACSVCRRGGGPPWALGVPTPACGVARWACSVCRREAGPRGR